MKMNSLPDWLTVTEPHRDIADGSFDESLFAADLGLVARGMGPADYLNPVIFAEKTYLTANLKAALVEVGNRLAGDTSAAAVHRMQTEFGGGKTHTMLAAYHLFGAASEVEQTQLGRDLAALLKGGALPSARVVVLDGSAMRADPETMPDGTVVHSFLGHLAYGLGGPDAYAEVAVQDRGLLGTSTTQMVKLLQAASPCLILMDETLEYLNKALEVKSHEGSLASTTLTVIKELTTAVSNVPGACFVATLTSSRMEDYSSVVGQEMQERLSKVVGRTENVVTPVEGDDIFPILHTRLFSAIGSAEERQAVADAYVDYYEQLGDALPSSFRDASYRTRIESAYPFHPEVIDILTNRWGSLSGFQRTRGALRTLAHTVKALSQSQYKGALIHAGDVPLYDAGVRGEVIRFAGESYKAALNADIIRPDSQAAQEDQRRGGEVAAARLTVGLATTAFLNSFGADKVLGAAAPQLLVGVARPGLSRGVIEDVRDAFKNNAWYMRYEGGRYRFTTEPNLNKVIMEREGAVDDHDVRTLVNDALKALTATNGTWQVILRVNNSNDLPDEQRLTLGVLDRDQTIGTGTTAQVVGDAQAMLTQRGPAARTNKNSVVLIAADSSAYAKARSTARNLAAMQDLKADTHRLKRFNEEQRSDLNDRISKAKERLPAQLVMAYRHLLVLSPATNGQEVTHIDLGPARGSDTIVTRVHDYLLGADRLLDGLAPAALLSERFGLLAETTDAVELDSILASFYRYPRLPKLTSHDVLRGALISGVQKGVFGLASGSAWDAPDALRTFSEPLDPSEVVFQPGTWLVRAAAITPLLPVDGPTGPAQTPTGPSAPDIPPTAPGQPPTKPTEPLTKAGSPGTSKEGGQPTRLTITVDEVPADKVRDVLKVAALPLTAQGANVRITFHIDVDAPDGVDSNTMDLVVAEGLRQLGVSHNIDKHT